MAEHRNDCEIVPFPKIRRLMVDGGRMGLQKHTIHGLLEMDVTRARQAIRNPRARTGEALSFTAFVMACLGQALDTNKYLHAYQNWRYQLVLFDEVDVNTLFEVEVDGDKIIRSHIIRAVNKKTSRDLHREIRAFQSSHEASQGSKFLRWFVLLPGVFRRSFLRILCKNPHLLKEYMGTVSLTAVGRFGTGGGWGIPVPNHTLQITLGGIAEKPGVVDGRIEIREILNVTMSIDHGVVDGAPAARFAQRLRELIESGFGLLEPGSFS